MFQLPSDQRSAPDRGRDRLAKARWVLLTTLSVEVAVLVVTGIALFFVYLPPVGHGLALAIADGNDWGVRVSVAVRVVHRVASRLAMPTAIAAGTVVAVIGRGRVHRRPSILVGVGIALVTIAASFTGFLLPWNYLALRPAAVRLSPGYRMLFGPSVRFVLIGGVEVSPHTVTRWLLIHMLVLGPALVCLLVLGWRGRVSLRRASPADVGAGTERIGSI